MPPEEVTQIFLGKFRMGIIGLKEAIEEVKLLRGQSDEEIAQALFERLRLQNYIPAASREEHKQAFLKEFKKACGEKVAEERHGLVVKVLGPGCASCENLERLVMTVAAELNLPAAVERVRDFKEIAALGILGAPALVINDEVKIVGSAPTVAVLKKWLKEAVEREKMGEEIYGQLQD